VGLYTTVIPTFLISMEPHNPLRWCLGNELTTDIHIMFPVSLVPVTVESSCDLWYGKFDMPEIAKLWRDFYQHQKWLETFPKMPQQGQTLGQDMRGWRDKYTSETNLLSVLTLAQLVPMKVVSSPCTDCAPVGEYVLVSGHMLHSPNPDQAEKEGIPYWKEAEISDQLAGHMVASHLTSDGFYEMYDEEVTRRANEWSKRHAMPVEEVMEVMNNSANPNDNDVIINDLTDGLVTELTFTHCQGWRLPPITNDRVLYAIARISHSDANRKTDISDWLYEAHQGYINGMGMRREEDEEAA
jgi:hypothetical protein